MKGKAIIQLFEDGKEVYRQEHNNIVTNTYKNLISPNFPIDAIIESGYELNLKTMTPMYKKMFGGVLLFSEETEANADNIMITKEHYYNFVGNAGGTFASNSIYRGSYNETESGWDEANQQWKQVWDFPTSAANGKIKCIGLCNRWLGDNGLIKDPNDTTLTSIINGYGSDLETPMLHDHQRYNSHNFLMNELSTLGYYLYSKSNTTNVYVRKQDNTYVFTEVNKRLNLKINDTLEGGHSVYLVDGENMFEFGEPIVLEFDTIPQDAQYLQYENGYIYAVGTTIETGTSITFTVYKIKAEDYTLESQADYTFYISTNRNTPYAIYFNNKIYLTFYGDYVNLYICDLGDQTFINREIDNGNYTPICCRFYDTIMIQRMGIRTENNNPVYILDSKDNLCKHNIKLYNALYDDDELYIFNKIFTNNDYYNYPVANASQLIKNYEVQNQIILPHLCSINNVNQFVKYNSQTMKITYILKDN